MAVLPANYAFVAGDNGVHTFTNGVTLKTAGTQSITATDTVTGTITGTQGSITVNPASATSLTVAGFPSPTTAGVAHSVTVSAHDAFGNTATGYTGTVHFTSTDGWASAGSGLPADYTFVAGDNGVHTFTNGVTLKTAGTQSITATDTVTGTITGTQGSITVQAAGASKLAFAQQPTTTTAGTAITPAVTVQVQDLYGNAVADSGATVNMTVSTGPGSFTGTSTTSATTNGSGLATFGNLVLNTSGTTYSLQAASSGLTSGTSGTFTVNAASATTLTVAGFTSPTAAGAAHNVTVTAHDTFGNVATGYTGTVHFTSTDGQATAGAGLPANYAFTGGDAGTHTFSATLKTAGTQSITATDTVTGTITGTQSSITVLPGVTSTLVVSAFPSPTTAGTAHSVTVTAQDAFGNTTPGYTGTVHFTSTDGQATAGAGLPANYTFVAGDNGVHTFTNGVTLKTAGTQSITATDTVTGTITGTQGSISVLSSNATTLVVSAFPSPTTAGVAHSVTVSAHDAFGNTATGYTGTVHFTSTDGVAVLPANYAFVAGDNGVHTFTNGVTLKTAGTQSITATDTVTGTITGTEGSITVNPASATSLTVAGFPSPTTAGVAHSVTVSAHDAFGNTATGYTGTVHFTSTDGWASAGSGLPADYTFVAGDNGVHTFTNGVTLKTAGTQSITATDTVTGTITGTEGSITVNPASATSLTVAGFPSPTTAGVAHSVTVTAQDAFGNTTPGYSGTVHFTSSDGQATAGAGLPANYTFVAGDNGVHTFTNGVTLKTAGTQSITATDTVTGTITGTQGSITVQAAAEAGIGLTNITQQPTPNLTCSGAVGSVTCTSTGEGSLNGNGNASARTVTASIQLEDQYGNAVTNTTGSAITVALSVGASSGTVNPTSLTIPTNQSVSTGQFTLVRSSGSPKTATMTAKVGAVTELTITLSS